MSEPHPAHPEPSETKPVLASDALRDDLAPVEPWKTLARVWLAVAGLLFTLLDFIPGQGRPVGAGSGVILGVLALAGGLLPISYALRAKALVVIGLLGALGAILGTGPARVVSEAVGFLAIVHWLAAMGLPTALLFRSRYRAYAQTRYFLVTGLGLTLPFIGYSIALFGRGPVGVQIAGALAILAIGFGLLGFMGADTHISGHYIAGAVIITITTQLGLQLFATPSTGGWLGISGRVGSLIAFATCNLLGALGAFQLLARRHWSEARSIDLRRNHPQENDRPSLGDSWMSHD